MLFHFSKRQRRIDTFAQLQRNPGGYVKICLLEPKTFPDGRSKKMIFSWLRDPRFEIDRGPGRTDTEVTLNSSLLSTGSTNEFSAASWRRVENREFYKECHSETLGASLLLVEIGVVGPWPWPNNANPLLPVFSWRLFRTWGEINRFQPCPPIVSPYPDTLPRHALFIHRLRGPL